MHETGLEPTPMVAELEGNEEATTGPKTKKRWAEFRQQLDVCKNYRKKLVRNWSTNIDYRRGKTFASQSDDDTISVNMDWSLTKTKQAALFSQVPHVAVSHPPESVAAGEWLSKFTRKLNDMLVKGGIEAAMDEIMPDCINAAGVGVVLISYEALTEDKEVPAIDISILPPQLQAEVMKTGMIFGKPMPMKTVPHPVSKRYTIRRISPSDFLWPVDFTGSDFDNAPWLGYTGRITWAEAVRRFNLPEEEKHLYLSDETTVEDRLSHDWDRERAAYDNRLGYDELFYWEHQYDSEAKSYDALHHLVFIHGKTEPVIDEPWKGQLIEESGKVIGALKSPVRVLTLDYISDENIPPSASAIGRSQVNELNKGRTQIIRQRERNIPYDWYDVNRLDPTIQQAIMRGTWLHAIPVQGDGSRVIGQVQKSNISQENFTFNEIAKQDLHEMWTTGPNQVGVGGDVETKGEASIIETNFTAKIGRERAKVASFVVGIAQVVGGLLCLYEDPAEFGEGFDPEFSQNLSYSILADSTVLVDANQRLRRLNDYLNKYAKSGYVNIEPVLREITMLIGLDPDAVVAAPKPQPPEQPNISLRLTSEKDMMNPLMLAFLIKSGQAPDPKLIEQAKTLIQQSVVEPIPPDAAQGAVGPMPPTPPIKTGEDNPQATVLPSIAKRSDAPEEPGSEMQ